MIATRLRLVRKIHLHAKGRVFEIPVRFEHGNEESMLPGGKVKPIGEIGFNVPDYFRPSMRCLIR